MIALIPARSGSKRILHKNTRLLAGHPLLAYTITAAIESQCFTDIIMSTDSEDIAAIGRHYGIAHSRVRIAPEGHQDTDADIVWIRRVLNMWPPAAFQTYAILRPTSPFRLAATIRSAGREFALMDQTCDSLRAVRPVTEHPAKMWEWAGPGYPITPLWGFKVQADGTPWHSSPTQSLPPVYVQTSSLEMFHAANVSTYGTFSGRKIYPFFTSGPEALSLDTEADWAEAERLVAQGVPLPAVALAGVPPLPAPV